MRTEFQQYQIMRMNSFWWTHQRHDGELVVVSVVDTLNVMIISIIVTVLSINKVIIIITMLLLCFHHHYYYLIIN